MKKNKAIDSWIYWDSLKRESDEVHREYKELQREPCSEELLDKLKLKESINLK